MLMLMLASRTQSSPAAIHSAELRGIRISAIELRIAPARK